MSKAKKKSNLPVPVPVARAAKPPRDTTLVVPAPAPEPTYVDALFQQVQRYVTATADIPREDNTLLIIPGGEDAKILANVINGKVRGVVAVGNEALATLAEALYNLHLQEVQKAAPVLPAPLDLTEAKSQKDWAKLLERFNSWKNDTDNPPPSAA